MKKFIVLVSFLAILLSACSSNSGTKNAQGSWESERSGLILHIKKNTVKTSMKGHYVNGTIKDDKNHKGVAKISLDGYNTYVKVKGNKLYNLKRPTDKLEDNNEVFKKTDD